MKISELVKLLTDRLDKSGDLDVCLIVEPIINSETGEKLQYEDTIDGTAYDSRLNICYITGSSFD